MKYPFLFYLFFFLASCQNDVGHSKETYQLKEKIGHDSQHLIGLASPIQLKPNTIEIILADYFLYPEKIDSVYGTGVLYDFDKERGTLKLTADEETQDLNILEVYIQGKAFHILMKNNQLEETVFELKDQDFKKVSVKGQMTNWQAKACKLDPKDKIWKLNLPLGAGQYQYLFIVDGKEILDPENQVKVGNGFGGFNSLETIDGPDLDFVPKLYGISSSEQKIIFGYDHRPIEVIALWENYRVTHRFIDNARIEVDVPTDALEMDRSFLRVYAYNSEGIGKDLLIPLSKGRPVLDAKELTRYDKESQVMYFALVDRFFNGSEDNDQPVQNHKLVEKTNYQGGDLQGIAQKIEAGYFEDLGVNSLWISPISENPSKAFQEYPEPKRWFSGYHGYWPISSTKIDARLGGEQGLKSLTEMAKKKKTNILLDFVCNHVHQDHPLYANDPKVATDLVLENGKKNIRIWDDQRLTTWFDEFLPTLDLENEAVANIQIDSALFWLKNYGIDGFRHDATKHIPVSFWRELTRRIKKEVVLERNTPVYQIGETYGSHDLINEYIGSGLLDAQFDFNLYFDTREALLKPEVPMTRLAEIVEASLAAYGEHHTMGNMTGNHDQPRYIAYASGAIKWDENAVEAGWNRKIGVPDPSGYKKLSSMSALMMFLPGVPVIFYGDEIGISGGGDPDNRRMMRFENLTENEEEVKANLIKMGSLRRSEMSLNYGETKVLFSDENVLVLSRTYFDQITIFGINKSSASRKIDFQLPRNYLSASFQNHFQSTFEKKQLSIEMEIPAFGFEVLSKR